MGLIYKSGVALFFIKIFFLNIQYIRKMDTTENHNTYWDISCQIKSNHVLFTTPSTNKYHKW